MKIAIHPIAGSFSDDWIAYCEENQILWKKVNCYSTDIIQQLEDCDILMWHFHQAHSKDYLFARQLIFSVEAMGIKVFPNFNTCWHFDDKLGQKYLLEAIKAPLIPSYSFFDKKTAYDWINSTTFPKVFKLRGGAASSNVKLVRTKLHAKRLVRKSFSNGFSQYNSWGNFKERLRKLGEGKTDFYDVMKGFARLFHTTKFAKVAGRERGYVYFQNFIPDNSFDLRIIVIGDKAYGIKRFVRKNDFRASGSGDFSFEKENFNNELIKLSFDISSKLKIQSVSFDFLYHNKTSVIGEISYGFPLTFCPKEGYWDRELVWHEGSYNAQYWMVENILKEVESEK